MLWLDNPSQITATAGAVTATAGWVPSTNRVCSPDIIRCRRATWSSTAPTTNSIAGGAIRIAWAACSNSSVTRAGQIVGRDGAGRSRRGRPAAAAAPPGPRRIGCWRTRRTPPGRFGMRCGAEVSRRRSRNRRTSSAGRKSRGPKGGRPPKFDKEIYKTRNTVERAIKPAPRVPGRGHQVRQTRVRLQGNHRRRQHRDLATLTRRPRSSGHALI